MFEIDMQVYTIKIEPFALYLRLYVTTDTENRNCSREIKIPAISIASLKITKTGKT